MAKPELEINKKKLIRSLALLAAALIIGLGQLGVIPRVDALAQFLLNATDSVEEQDSQVPPTAGSAGVSAPVSEEDAGVLR